MWILPNIRRHKNRLPKWHTPPKAANDGQEQNRGDHCMKLKTLLLASLSLLIGGGQAQRSAFK